MEKKILNLNHTKASQQPDILTKIKKTNVDIFCEMLHLEINKTAELSKLPCFTEIADVTPFCKNKSRAFKDKFCPVRILSNLSKVFERRLRKQFSPYFNNVFLKKQCGFRKNYSTQHRLAKKQAYGIHTKTLRIIKDYLPKRARRTSLTEIQFLEKIKYGFPRASKLGAIYLKIHLYDMLFIKNDVDAEKI